MQNKFKRLAIISDCIHMQEDDGNIVTENHIFCRQIQALATYFEHTVICCPFIRREQGSVTSTYTLHTIEFIHLPNVGGKKLKHKLRIIKTIPAWIKAFKKVYVKTDIVYLRMPNNLSIPGFFYFYVKRSKKFATYTGNWENYKQEPFSYRFQKWILKNFFNGPVWIYTGNENAKNLLKGFSPSYSEQEWCEEENQVKKRIERYRSAPITKPVFITVVSLVPHKNPTYILEVCKRLRDKKFNFHWYITGDGYLRDELKKFVSENDLPEYVTLTGKKTYQELRELYRKSDFLVQAVLVEPFGKTPIEALFHGVIPVLNVVAMSDEMTGKGSRGYSFTADDPDNLVQLIYKIMDEQPRFAGMIDDGRNYVKEQTLENWAFNYYNTINSFFEKNIAI
jgi:glycosyltransferase involved in cell wall biosynthesis